jgi:mannose-6-phosphate isomerase-like protein (cupin superfamily)
MSGGYDINLDDRFGHLTPIDVGAEAAAHEPWFNQTLVLEGELVIEIEGRDTVRLRPHQGFTMPRGVAHRTSAPVRTVILMVEPAGVVPTGD